MSTLFVIAGAHGTGKTTTIFDLVPPGVPVINSDEMAKQLKASGSANFNLQESENQGTMHLTAKYTGFPGNAIPVFNFTPIILGLSFFAIACSITPTISQRTNAAYIDTVYRTTTQQLRNDRIPDSVFQMTNLRNLTIQGMDCDYGDHITCWMIREIPVQIKNLTKLETLQMNVNAITIIPSELSELKNLRLIDLSDNPGLSNINYLINIKSLEQLFLYGCNLETLPDNIGELRNLRKLELVGNHLNKNEQARIRKALPNCQVSF